MSESQVDLSGGCDFYVPGQDGEVHPCDEAARERTLPDAASGPVEVALCDEHFAYVSAPEHAHYWFVERSPKGSRSFIRLMGRRD